MKKILLVAALLATAPMAYAQAVKPAANGPVYYGLGVGYTDLDSPKSSAVTYTKDDTKDVSFKVFGGYKINAVVAVEAAYHKLGKTDAAGTAGGNPISASNKGSAYVLAAKLAPISSESFSPFLKVGMSNLTNKENGLDNGVAYSSKKTKLNPYFSIGFEAALTEKVAFAVEYESFGKSGTTDVNNSRDPWQIKPKSLGLSLIYRP